MQLAKDYIGSVPSQDIGLRNRGFLAHFIGVAENEFARLEWLLLGICTGNPAPLDCGMADPIAKSKRLLFIFESVTILTPDCRDTFELFVRFASRLEYCFKSLSVRRQHRNHRMNVRSAERLFPMLSAVLSDVAKSAGACRHALPKFPGETVERFRRHAQGFQAFEGERNAYP